MDTANDASLPLSLSLSPSLLGLAVMEWCRHGVDGVTHEEMRRIIARTEEETSIQLIVKECRSDPHTQWMLGGSTAPLSTLLKLLGRVS